MKNQRWRYTMYFVVLALMVIILFLYLGLWKDPQKEIPLAEEGEEVRETREEKKLRSDRDPPKPKLSEEPKSPNRGWMKGWRLIN
jgi:hypothetical protein